MEDDSFKKIYGYFLCELDSFCEQRPVTSEAI